MTTGATGQLGLALPVQGELSGTWGDTVNNGITQYTNIAIAGTLTLTGDGAVTLANTTGDASASNITSTLSGAGTVTAQFAIVRVSGTTTTKVVTGPSYSKTYVVDNASSYAVTFKASGQTGVSIAAAEKVTVVFNGTDYIKLAGTIANAAGSNTQIQFNNGGLFGASANLTWDGTTLSSTQINITGQGTLRLQDTTGGEYVAHRAPSALGASYTLTWPADDGTSGQALITDGSGVLSWSTAASGDVYGPASSTDNAVARFDGTTGKLIQDSVVLIGDTGAVTGVTDLTASGSVTLSGGTANGVTYLNGSKVLTSGSALTFDGSVLTLAPNRVTFGSSTILELGASSYFKAGSTLGFTVNDSTDTYNYFRILNNGNAVFYPSGSEGMRLTSTGLGIGTSSPGAKLTVSDTTSAAATAIATFVGQGSYSMGIQSVTNSASTVGNRFNFNIGSGGGEFSWSNNGGTLAYLNSSGNLGIGTSSPSYKLQAVDNGNIYATSAISNSTAGTSSLARFLAISDAGNAVLAMTSSSYTDISGAQDAMLLSASNASGGIAFALDGTLKMKLDSAGNLGIGTSSPNAKLDVVGGNMAVLSNTAATAATASTYALWVGNSATRDMTLGSDATYSYIQSWSGKHLYLNSQGNNVLVGSGNVGIGTSSPDNKLVVNGALAFSYTGSLSANGIKLNAVKTEYFNTITSTSSDVIHDFTGFSGASKLVITQGGNVGIGTSSPAAKLEVNGGSAYVVNTNGRVYIQNGNTSGGAKIAVRGTSDTADGYLAFETYSREFGRFDSAGNLGLGVTPSSWASGTRGFNIGSGSAIWNPGSGNQTHILTNAYNDGTDYIYRNSTNASRYSMVGNAHQWHIAPSGTAGNAISFTQAMTLDSSGNLLIGKTSTAVTNTTGAQISPNGITLSTNTGSPTIDLRASNASVAANIGGVVSFSSVYLNSNSDTTNIAFIKGLRENATNNSWSSYISFETTNGTTLAERARIDSSGNLLVGTTATAAAKVTIVSTTNPALTLPNIAEIATVSATAATGTINYDLTTQSVLYYTTNASGNFTMNIRGNSGLSLNSMMSTGQSVTMAFLCTNGSTAYYQSAMTIDGTSVTPKWQGGTAPSSGNASSVDIYSYTIIKTGSATYTVFASQTKFA